MNTNTNYTFAYQYENQPDILVNKNERLFYIQNSQHSFYVCGSDTQVRNFYSIQQQQHQVTEVQSAVITLAKDENDTEPDMLFVLKRGEENTYLIGTKQKVWNLYEPRGYKIACVQTYIIRMMSSESKALETLSELQDIINRSMF